MKLMPDEIAAWDAFAAAMIQPVICAEPSAESRELTERELEDALAMACADMADALIRQRRERLTGVRGVNQ